MLRKEECAGGMRRIAILMMNLLHLDQNSNSKLQFNPNPVKMALNLPPRERWGRCQEIHEV